MGHGIHLRWACWLCVSIPLVIAKFGDTENGHSPRMVDAAMAIDDPAMAKLQKGISTVTALVKRQTEEIQRQTEVIHTLQTDVHKLSTKTASVGKVPTSCYRLYKHASDGFSNQMMGFLAAFFEARGTRIPTPRY